MLYNLHLTTFKIISSNIFLPYNGMCIARVVSSTAAIYMAVDALSSSMYIYMLILLPTYRIKYNTYLYTSSKQPFSLSHSTLWPRPISRTPCLADVHCSINNSMSNMSSAESSPHICRHMSRHRCSVTSP